MYFFLSSLFNFFVGGKYGAQAGRASSTVLLLKIIEDNVINKADSLF